MENVFNKTNKDILKTARNLLERYNKDRYLIEIKSAKVLLREVNQENIESLSDIFDSLILNYREHYNIIKNVITLVVRSSPSTTVVVSDIEHYFENINEKLQELKSSAVELSAKYIAHDNQMIDTSIIASFFILKQAEIFNESLRSFNTAIGKAVTKAGNVSKFFSNDASISSSIADAEKKDKIENQFARLFAKSLTPNEASVLNKTMSSLKWFFRNSFTSLQTKNYFKDLMNKIDNESFARQFARLIMNVPVDKFSNIKEQVNNLKSGMDTIKSDIEVQNDEFSEDVKDRNEDTAKSTAKDDKSITKGEKSIKSSNIGTIDNDRAIRSSNSIPLDDLIDNSLNIIQRNAVRSGARHKLKTNLNQALKNKGVKDIVFEQKILLTSSKTSNKRNEEFERMLKLAGVKSDED